MIEVKNVSKKFIKNDKKEKISFLADEDITFTAHEGEIVGILGPNGAGKTTLLRMIAGIMKPTSGTITINGMTYDNNDIEIKEQIAFLSGNTKLYKDITGYELLKMCGEYYHIDPKKIDEIINDIVKEFALEGFINQRIGTLSTGQNQRVAIARCALHNPKYYILDEATSGLDTILSQIVLDFIKGEKNKGKCILYSTHYMEEAENICDRVVIINKGKVVRVDSPDNIKKETKTTNLRDAFFKLIGGIKDEK